MLFSPTFYELSGAGELQQFGMLLASCVCHTCKHIAGPKCEFRKMWGSGTELVARIKGPQRAAIEKQIGT